MFAKLQRIGFLILKVMNFCASDPKLFVRSLRSQVGLTSNQGAALLMLL